MLPALLLLVGCGTEDGGATDGTRSSSPGTPSTPSVTTDPPPVADGSTPPGTELALGDPATVPLQAYGREPSGVAQVAVTAIDPVGADDLAAAGGSTSGARSR